MKGKFYGVGVGPGDPELLTIKAIRVMKECEVIAIALSKEYIERPKIIDFNEQAEYEAALQACVAYQIALESIPELKEKELLLLPMPMIKDTQKLKLIHEADAIKVMEILKKGKSVAFITLGDPTVYSTVLYVHKHLQDKNYETHLIPGVPSFCSAAARLNIGLVENREELHILPASYEIEQDLRLQGTKILMKTGKQIAKVKQLLRNKNYQVEMVENCGMKNEKIYRTIDDIPETAGYYSLMIIKEAKE